MIPLNSSYLFLDVSGPTPDRAATFAKRKNAAMGGYMGPNISGKYDGVELSNPTYRKYYGSKIIP